MAVQHGPHTEKDGAAARVLDVGIVTDEVARKLAVALDVLAAWGVRCLELREGGTGRFPNFTREEQALVEAAVAVGSRVTAVSPGILKGPVEDRARLRHELEQVLPRTLDLARRLQCPTLIVFGFERYEGEPPENQLPVLHAFEQVAERADRAGLTVAVENEPHFWVDGPEETAALLAELDHPAMRANWDPANVVWGGGVLRYEAFTVLRPFIHNLHVKDVSPEDADAPWRPVGRGTVPWEEILQWIAAETALQHVTLETHCEPLKACSEESLDWLRATLRKLGVEGRPAAP